MLSLTVFVVHRTSFWECRRSLSSVSRHCGTVVRMKGFWDACFWDNDHVEFNSVCCSSC